MTKSLILILTLALLKANFWTIPKHSNLNVDTWEIRIGHKRILDWQKNQIGDTAFVDKRKIRPTDTLFVQRYLCGQSGQNSITTLTIENEKNEIIQQSTNTDNQFIFTASIPLAKLLSSSKTTNAKILNVRLGIHSQSHKLVQTLLLGRLCLR